MIPETKLAKERQNNVLYNRNSSPFFTSQKTLLDKITLNCYAINSHCVMGFRYVARQATSEDTGDILRLIKDLAL